MLMTEADILALIAADAWRMRALTLVRDLNLPDCWIVAGFVRCLVWDVLHDYQVPTMPGDIDVVFFDPTRSDPHFDRQCEQQLSLLGPEYPWEVYNQAHMHHFNRHQPYTSCQDAFMRWAETVSTVGLRLNDQGQLELAKPHGIQDLIEMIIRPTPHPDSNRAVFHERLTSKGWLDRWPKARVILD